MTNPAAYVAPLVELFEAHASDENATHMKRYMRNQFDFLGIKTPLRRALIRQFLSERRKLVSDRLRPVVRTLWRFPFREYQYAAVDLLVRFGKTLKPADLPLLERLVTRKSWWDTVDGLATGVVGPLLRRYPRSRDEIITVWRRADNLWLRRTSLIFQLKYKDDTDVDLLFSVIRDNIRSSEFFLQKAIGWALREYSKTDPHVVRRFVDRADLAPLSKREALKWLESHPE